MKYLVFTMKPKTLLVIFLFIVVFVLQTTTTFSFNRESNRNSAIPSITPFSFNINNSLSDGPQAKIMDSIVRDFLNQYDIVGSSVAVTNNGRLVYAKGFGYADVENHTLVNPGSLFRIASVSKLITAVAIMKLVENEKLKLNQKVFGPAGILNDSIYMHYRISGLKR
jgi:CubicO group peptidase (beta-lactamase class C family)